jgi:hypothetical protein
MMGPSGTVTFLFTDVEGSTRLWEAVPEAMRVAVARHDAIVRAAIERRGGYVFSTAGDSFAAAFARATDGLGAAVDAQAALATEGWPEGAAVRVRMGVHTGEASERDGDYFGPSVNRAARLMDAGHGGQVLVGASTAAVVGSSGLVDLGEHRLRDLAEPQRVFQWGPTIFPPLRVLDTALSNLPLQATELVGRRSLVGEVADLVLACRVLTLTGPGGVGKTRLALEVGAEMLPKFADGVWLVDLAPVAQEEMVLPTIARVLGIAAQSGESLITTMLSRLVSKRTVVILDNCEHLIAAVAGFVEHLGASGPEVRILATSREGLSVPGERVLPVPRWPRPLRLWSCSCTKPCVRTPRLIRPAPWRRCGRSAVGWMAFRWPSSWPRPGLATSVPSRSPHGWTSVSDCSPAGPAPPSGVIAPCRARWPGRTTCWTQQSSWSFSGCR